MKEEIIFPWIATVSDRFCKTFASDYLLEDLQFLSMNIDSEVNQALQKQSKDKNRSLFAVLINFYNHFCGKLQHQKDSFYLNVICAKILSSLISIGLILSNGKTDSKWIKHVLGPMRMFPGNYETIYHSLLLVTNLKKKYHACYFVILRQLLCSEFNKCVMDPETYMTIMLLCRRLKRISKKQEELDVLSIVSKIEPPPNIEDCLFEKGGDMQLKSHKLLSRHLMTSKFPVSTLETIRKVILKKWCLKNSAQDTIVQKKEDELFVIDTGNISETKGVSRNLKSKKKNKKIVLENIATNSKSRKKNKKKMDIKLSKELPHSKETIPTTSRDLESYRVDLPNSLKPLSCHCNALKQKNRKRKHELKKLKSCETLCSNCKELVITVDCDSDTKSVRQVKKRKIWSEDCHKNNLVAADKCGTKANADSSLSKTRASDVQSVKKRRVKRKKIKVRTVATQHSPISVMGEPKKTDNFDDLESSSELCIKTTSTNEQNEEINSSSACNLSEQKNLNTEIKNVDQDKNLICIISKELPVTDKIMQPSTQVSSNSNVEAGIDLIELVSQNFDTDDIHTKKSAITSNFDKIDKEAILTNDKDSSIEQSEERMLKKNNKEYSVDFENNIISSEEQTTQLSQSSIIPIKYQSSTVPEEKTNPSVVQCKSDSGDSLPQSKICLSRKGRKVNELPCEKGVAVDENKSNNVVNVSNLKGNMNLTEDIENVEKITTEKSELHSHIIENILLTEEKSEFHSHSLKSTQSCDSPMENISRESSTHSEQSKIVTLPDQSSVSEEETNPIVGQSKSNSGDIISWSQNDTCVSNEMPSKKENNLETKMDNKAVLPDDSEIDSDKEKDISLPKVKSELHSHSSENIPLLEEKSEFFSHVVESIQSCENSVENINKGICTHPGQSEKVTISDQSTVSVENDPNYMEYMNNSGNTTPCSEKIKCVSKEHANANEMPDKKDNNLENITRNNEAILSAELEINHDKEKDISFSKEKSEFHSHSTVNIPLLEEKSEFHSHSIEAKQSCDTIEHIKDESPTHSSQSKIVATEDPISIDSEPESNPSFVQCSKDSENAISCSQNETCVPRKVENSNDMPEKKDIAVDDSKCETVINVSNSKNKMKLTEDINNVEKISVGNEFSHVPDLEIHEDKKESISLSKRRSELLSNSTENIPLQEKMSEFHSDSVESKQSCDSSIEKINIESSTHSEQPKIVATKNQNRAISKEDNNTSVVRCRNDSRNSMPCSQNETCLPNEDANANKVPSKEEKNLENITQGNEAVPPAELEISHDDDDADISLPKEKPEFHSQGSEFKQFHDIAVEKLSQREGDMKSPKKSIQPGDLKLIEKYSCSADVKDGKYLGLSSSDSEYMTLEEVNESSEEFVFVESSDSVEEIELSKSSICTRKGNKRSKLSSGSISLNLKRKGNNLSSDVQQSTHLQSKECSTDKKLVNSVSFPDSVVCQQFLSFAEVSKHEKNSPERRILPSVQSSCQSKSHTSDKKVHYTDNVSSKYNIEATTSKVGNKISVLVEFSKKKPNELNFDDTESLSGPDSKHQLCSLSSTEENSSKSENETPPYRLRSTGSRTVPCSEIICIPATDVGDSEKSNKKSPQVSLQVQVNMGKRCNEKESLSSTEMLSVETETHSNSETNSDINLYKNDSSASRPIAPCIEDSVSDELTSKREKKSDYGHHAELVRKPITRSSQQEVEKVSTDLNHNNNTFSVNKTKKEYNSSNMRVTNLFFENVRDETDSIHSQESYSSGSNIIESDNSDTSEVTQIDRKRTLRSSSKNVTKEKSTSNVKPKIYPLRRRKNVNTESSSNNFQLGIDLSTLSLKSPCIKIPLLSVEDESAVDKTATVSLNKVSEKVSRNIFNQEKIELPKRETRASILKAEKDEEKLEEKSANESYNLRPKRSIIAPSRLKL